MMKKPTEKEPFLVDLSQVEGDGSFKCPRCGLAISPEDETEDNYQIVDTKVQNNDLIELVITCGKCESTIRLTGFNSEA